MFIKKLCIGSVFLGVMSSAFAINLHVDVDRPDDDNTEMEVLTIPYGFYNENTGRFQILKRH